MHSAERSSAHKDLTKEATLQKGYLVLDELSFFESIELRYYSKGICVAVVHHRLTETGVSLTIAAKCAVRLVSPIDVSVLSISTKSKLCFESSVRVSNRCEIRSKSIRCREASIHCSGQVSIKTHALYLSKKSDLRFQGDSKTAELVLVNKFRVSLTSRLILSAMRCKTKACDLIGKLYCQNSQLIARSLLQSGLLALNQSTVLLRRYDQSGSAKSVFSSSSMRSNRISLSGDVKAKRSHLKGDIFLLRAGSFLIQKKSSVLCSRYMVMLAEANCSVSHSQLVCLNDGATLPCSIDIQATGRFNRVVFQADEMSVRSKDMVMSKTSIQANRSCLFQDSFELDDSHLSSPELRLGGRGRIQKTQIRSRELSIQLNQSDVSDTKIRCDRCLLQGEELALVNTRIVFSALSVSGDVSLVSGSELTGVYDQNKCHEIQGKLRVEQSSLQCAGKIYSSTESEVSLYSSDVVVPAWMCESTLLESQSGTLLTGAFLQAEGVIQAESCLLSVSGDAIFSGVRVNLCGHSTLKAHNVYVSNGTCLDVEKSHAVVLGKVYTAGESTLSLKKASLEAASLLLAGQYKSVGCQLFSDSMAIMGKATIRQSAFSIKEDLVFDVGSMVSMEGSVVESKRWKARGNLTHQNVAVSAERVSFSASSQSHFAGKNLIKGYVLDVSGDLISGEDKENDAGLFFCVRDRVNCRRAAYLSGKNPIRIETTQFNHLGRMRSESRLELKAHSIVNRGSILAEQIDMKADWGVLNRGSLRGKRMSITGSFVNLMGTMDAEESISIVGPLSANVLGRISSAHYVSSAFLSLPMGLSLSNFRINRGCLNQYTFYSMLQTMSLIFFGPSVPLLSRVFSLIGLMSSTTIGISAAAQVAMVYAAGQASYLRPHEWYPAIGAAAQVVKSAFLDVKILRNLWRSFFNPWHIPDGDRAPEGGDQKKDGEDKKDEKGDEKDEIHEEDGKSKEHIEKEALNKGGPRKDDLKTEKLAGDSYWDAILARATGVSEYWVKKGRGWMMYASSVVSNWNRYSAFAVVSPLFGTHSDNALLSMNAGLGFHSTEFDTLVVSTDVGAHFRVNGITEAVFLYNTGTRYGIEESARSVWMVQAGQIKALDNASLMATYFWNKGGSAEADNLRLELGRMDDPQKIICGEGEWAKYKARKTFIFSSWNDLILEEEILRKCGLILTGYSVDLNVDYETEGVVLLNSTKGDVVIHDKVKVIASHVGVNSANDCLNEGDVAGNTFAIRARGNVTNTGNIVAVKFGYVEAGGDITNQCRKRVIQGRYSQETWYDPASIIGGTGDGNGGPGLVMKAGGKIISDASFIASKGDNILIADQGFEFKEEHDWYISKKRDERTCFGLNRNYSETWSMRVFQSMLVSTNGKNVLISKNGGLWAKAAVFNAALGNYADVKGDISMFALKVKSFTLSKRGIIGLESTTKRMDEAAVWTEVHDDGFSRFCSRNGDVDLSGAYVWGDGDLALIAPNGQVIFDDEVLNHSVYQSGFTMGVSIPIVAQVADVLNGSKSPLSLDPMSDRLRRLAKSKKGLEWLINGTSAGISVYNAVNAWGRGLSGDLKAELFARYGLGGAQGFSPNAKLSLGWRKSRYRYQTTAGCGVNRGGNLYIQAGKGVVMDHGVQVHADGDIDVDAPSIVANGVDLLSDYKSSEVGIGVNAGLGTMSPTGVGVSTSQSSGTASYYRNAVLSAGGNMHLHYGKKAMQLVVLDGARLEANSFDGGIVELRVRDHLSSYSRKSSSVGIDSKGDVNASKSSASGSYVDESSGLFSKEGFNTKGHQFHIHHAVMEGGAIESQEEGTLDIDVLEARPVPEAHDSSSVGISFNVNDLERLGGKEPTGEPGEKAIASVDVSKDERHYRASRRPFVGNAGIADLQGDVARTKEQVLQVWANRQASYLMSLPLTNQAYLTAARKNIGYVYRVMFNAMGGSSSDRAGDLAMRLAYWKKQRQLLNELLKVDFSDALVEPESKGNPSLYDLLIVAAIRFSKGSFEQIVYAIRQVKLMQFYLKLRSMASAASLGMLLEAGKDASTGMARVGKGVVAGVLGDALMPQLARPLYAEAAADPIFGVMMAVAGILDAATYNAARNQAWIAGNRGILLSLGGEGASGVAAAEKSLRAFSLMALASWSEAFHTANGLPGGLAAGVLEAAASLYDSTLGLFSPMEWRSGTGRGKETTATPQGEPLSDESAPPPPPNNMQCGPGFIPCVEDCFAAAGGDLEAAGGNPKGAGNIFELKACLQQCFEDHCDQF